MPYVEGRTVHDADSHVMETPDWYFEFADPDVRPRLQPLGMTNAADPNSPYWVKVRAEQNDPEHRSHLLSEVMLHKNWAAPGAFLKEHRSAALDAMGFASQLVFATWASGALQKAEHSGDDDLTYGFARAHNRAMVDFCSVDERLLAVGYVPLSSIERAGRFTAEALDQGAAALMVASACPPGHSPSHIGLEPVWAQAAEAGVPIVLHVGGGGRLLDPNYFVNGLPPVPDFHGGDGNFRSVDYVAIQYPVMQTLATLIIDGVLERHPELRIGVIEQGASWLPGLMRTLDSAHEAFRKNETRLQALSLKPSEYLRRQVRVTPYPHEDAGWVIEQSGEEMCLFSSDYPHVEGGRNPMRRFEASVAHLSDAAKDRFYRANFVDLMGPQLSLN